MNNDTFEFSLGQRVTLVLSGEIGTITARIDYLDETQGYYVEYKNNSGNAVTGWFKSRQLEVI